ncbi:MAG TPA: LytTR family DNA-binding domain-containing protein [Chryseosolibacter sp.]
MKVRCLIVEDEPLARNLLAEYVKKVSNLELAETCSSPLQAMEVLRNNAIDLMFLDIQMPEITGITLLKTLQKKPLVILTTAYSEYALESYELDVVDYLLKPITFDRFLRAVDKASHRLSAPAAGGESTASEPQRSFVFVKDGTKLVKVNFDDILYVEGLKDYVTIVTKTQKIVSLQRLKALEAQLPPDKFIRVHHSYIIALKAIDSIHRGEVRIGPHVIPVSDSYKTSFKEFIDRNQMQ